uniref:C3H1-type domain-containing protein n=1 Tax=Timema tahoe TaxID=61484 RepID=A0A7R9FKH6_9NEOP|nr:unnamed protein product [Timema tahoe]
MTTAKRDVSKADQAKRHETRKGWGETFEDRSNPNMTGLHGHKTKVTALQALDCRDALCHGEFISVLVCAPPSRRALLRRRAPRLVRRRMIVLFTPLGSIHLELAAVVIETSYVDTLCSEEREDRTSYGGGEDSSYDSDYDAEDSGSHQDVSRTVSDAASHQDVSRTASDTLGAEYEEYVSGTGQQPPSAGYTAKVEFGLKLGYTEKLVQAALHKLGPNPGQNELLEELIKLGAQVPRLQDVTPEGCDEVLEEQGDEPPSSPPLRPVVIDGSNVAMGHGNKKVFSCRGIKLCVEWFRTRDQDILLELERDRCLVFTPSRLVGGKRMACYDDRYILRLAADVDGIVVSNDNYRDLASETPEFKKVVEERILMYSFVNDRFMPPDDPLGRSGPTLENFLRKQPRRGDPPPPCPYGKKCTYGNKCKFYHPERGPLPHKTVTERLLEQAQKQLQARGLHSRDSSPEGGDVAGANLHRKLQRQLTLNPTFDPRLYRMRRKLYYHLASIFPEEQVQKAMQIYPDETNPQRICAAILAMFPKP